MKPRVGPILMSAAMVLALNDKLKTQTRRTTGLELYNDRGEPGGYERRAGRFGVLMRDTIPDDPVPSFVPSPYGGPGDVLYVREGVKLASTMRGLHQVIENGRKTVDRDLSKTTAAYLADGKTFEISSWPWKKPQLAGIHMPQGFARHWLELDAVRVERLQAISDTDAIAEGLRRVPARGRGAKAWTFEIGGPSWPGPAYAYAGGWATINGPDSWGLNPWVWVLTFHPIRIKGTTP